MDFAARSASSRAALAITVALAALTATQPAHAQWKWRDKAGQVHISDRAPPPDTPEASILQRPVPVRAAPPQAASAPAEAPAVTAAATAASGPANKLEAEVEARRKKAEQEEKARQKALEEKNAVARAENCQRARRHLATLESGQRMARINDKGEREVLDDKARAAETDVARKVVASDCG
jgi:hypothetical protein